VRRTDAPEGGFVTVWILGLCVMLLFLGGMSLDLWRAFSERRAIAELADAAATAGASGIDEQIYRASGQVVLDPARAEQLARDNLAAQADTRSFTGADVQSTTRQVTVRAHGAVHFSLLRVFTADRPFEVTVTAVAEPRASP
jgi:Flp pilus assembly protein TadG